MTRPEPANAVIRIGCLPHLPIQQLLAFLGALGLHEPRLETRVTHTHSREQLLRLERGDLDLAMLHDPGAHAGVEIEPVFAGEPLAAFLPVGHRLGARQALRPADLLDESLVTFARADDPELHDRRLELIGDAGYRFRTVVEVGGHHVRDVLLEVAQGRGIALVSTSLAEATDAHAIVQRRELDPAVAMPDTVVALPVNRPHHLGGALAAVKDVARELRRAAHGDARDARS